MTAHLIFFFIDLLAWISVGFIVGMKLYPLKKRGIYAKIPFTIAATITSTMGGLFYTMLRGLPDEGFSIRNLFAAIIITLMILWVFNLQFRKKYSRKINSFYTNFLSV